MAAAAGNFALGPGRSNAALDFDNDNAVKFYFKAIKPLLVEFEGKAEAIIAFLAGIQDRARNFGWDPILNIPCGTNTYHLIQDYGSITLQQVQAFALTYCGQINNRNAQNSEMLYHCIMNSLSVTFKTEVLLHYQSFRVNNNPDGPCLLKQILNITFIDNKGTVTFIQQSLIAMPSKLAELNGDITKLNSWVLGQVQKLAALGETATDLLLLPHLWNAYLSSQDTKFVLYIEQIMNQHEDGSQIRTYPSLMLLADNHFKLRVQKGQWCQQTSKVDQNDLVAMVAQLQKTLQGKKKKGTPKAESKNKSDSNRREGWKFVGPQQGEEPIQQKNDRTYHWCPNHDKEGMWTLHEPSICNNTKHPNHPLNKSRDVPAKKGPVESSPKNVFKALSAIAEGFGDGECSSDEE